MRPLLHALPAEHEANADAGLRALLSADFIEARSVVSASLASRQRARFWRR
jgi:hypothetical protein